MSISKYRAFVSAVETRSFTKTGEKLGYTQSGVSHLIRALESELGLTLLLRTRNGIELTTEGERLYPVIRQLIAAEEEIQTAAAELRGLTAGVLRIGCFSSFAIGPLPRLLQSFGTLFPKVDVRLTNGSYATIERALLENEIDCGFVRIPTCPSFEVFPCMSDRMMAIVPENSPLAALDSVTVDLLDPFIIPAEGSNYDIGELFDAAHVVPNIRFTMDDDYAAVTMVSKGLGCTILPELLIRQLPVDGVAAVPIVGSRREIGLAYDREHHLSHACRAFLDHVRANREIV